MGMQEIAAQWRAAMPVGPPPSGLRYVMTWNNAPRIPATSAFCILGAVLGGEVVGYMTWGLQGRKVQSIWVRPDLRRRRIAETMFERAKSVDPSIAMHADRTDLGDAWIQHMEPGIEERLHNTTEDTYKDEAGWTISERLLSPSARSPVVEVTGSRTAAKRMPAKFPGTCVDCSKRVERGEMIYYDGKVHCDDCGRGSASAPQPRMITCPFHGLVREDDPRGDYHHDCFVDWRLTH